MQRLDKFNLNSYMQVYLYILYNVSILMIYNCNYLWADNRFASPR